MAKVAVLGSGGWGTALAIAFSKQGHSVSLWSAFGDEIKSLNDDREHKKLLPGAKIPNDVVITENIDCVLDKDVIVLAVPSFAVRDTVKRFKEIISSKSIVVNVSKGVENDSLKRLSVVIKEELPRNKIVVLSGPSHAEEVAWDKATSLVAASRSIASAKYIQSQFNSSSLRIYTNTDVIGVELGGALKNVMAICKGIIEGAGLGDNCIAAMMTRGLTEMARLGVKMGARRRTFAGLTGIGDLVVTCMSPHSRNHRCGVLIGQGMNVKDAMDKIGMTVEGYHATLTAKQLAEKYNVRMPIVEECYAVMYEQKSVENSLRDLMARPVGQEEDIW